MYNLNLSQPIPLIVNKKLIPATTKFVQQPLVELLTEEDRKSDVFKKFRYVVGKTDIKLTLDDMWDLNLFFLPKRCPYPQLQYSGVESLREY